MDKFNDKLKENLIQFWQFFSSYWKRFHMTKIVAFLVMLSLLVVGIYLNILARNADVETLRDGLEQTTLVMDVNGEEAGELHAQKGTFVSIDQISSNFQDALISTEDHRFYSHRGFDPIGIMRAAFGYVINGGHIVGGGSTITQQLAKNSYFSSEQTIIRKLKELFVALEIEKHYSKDQILEMYLNHAYFGNGVWGVQDASLRYFAKPASDVTISEAATLIGLLKAPSNYNPLDNYEKAIKRRNIVLMLMEETKAITPEERQIASQSDLALSNAYNSTDGYRYPQYFDAVISEAVNKYNFDEDDLLNQGYTIYTTLNQNYQVQLQKSIDNNASYIEKASDGSRAQVASVAIDPKTGGINGLIGNIGNYTFRGYNRATQMRRQPGSVIKPLGVYAPALENGFKVDSMLVDEEITYAEENEDESYTPKNLSGSYQGQVPMYEALAKSLNAPTVWLLDQIGIKAGMDSVEKFGLKVTQEDRHLGAISLGGMSVGATPVEIASAYSVFANDGVRIEPHIIRQIVDPQGNVVVDNTKPNQKRVLSSQANEDMNRMNLGVFESGTAQKNQPRGYKIAGKTGTTQNPSGPGNSDQWIAAYTPDVVISGWMGFDETNDQYYLKNYASQGIGMILKAQMEAVIPYTEQNDFTVDYIKAQESGEDTSNESGISKVQETMKNAWEDVKRGANELYDGANNLWKSIQP